MASFQVPQFIEEKPKIIGFLTLAQFFYVAIPALISFIAFKTLSFFIWLPLTGIVGGLGVTLAFARINGQSMPLIARAALKHLLTPHAYTWQRPAPTTAFDVPDIDAITSLRNSMSVQDKLKSLALQITTGKLFKPHTEPQGERYQVVRSLSGDRTVAKRIDY